MSNTNTFVSNRTGNSFDLTTEPVVRDNIVTAFVVDNLQNATGDNTRSTVSFALHQGVYAPIYDYIQANRRPVTVIMSITREDGVTVDERFQFGVNEAYAAIAEDIWLTVLDLLELDSEYDDLDGGDDSNSDSIKSINYSIVDTQVGGCVLDAFKLNIPTKIKNSTWDPNNEDNHCFLRCIHKAIKSEQEYEEWYIENNLVEFTDSLDERFDITRVADLEKHLKININVFYIDELKKQEFLYMTSLSGDPECTLETIHILFVSYDHYTNTANVPFVDPDKKQYEIDIKKEVHTHNLLVEDGIYNRSYDGHYLLITDMEPYTNKRRKYVCDICTKAYEYETQLENHKDLCKKRCKEDSVERLVKYKENVEAYFTYTTYSNRWMNCFASYDFETRYCTELNQHIAVSFGITYVNIFAPEKSFTIMYDNKDEKKVLEQFVKAVAYISKHHTSLFSEDDYTSKKVKDKTTCKLCLLPLDKNDPMDYNHSHAKDDNVNIKLEGYTHPACNKAAQQKKLPLRFFAHNSRSFDSNIVIKALVHPDNKKYYASLTNIIPKSMNKYTQIGISFEESISVCFNDSMMHLAGSLEEIIGAYLKTEESYALLKDQLKKKYPTYDQEALYQISKLKAPMPYSKISHEHFPRTENFPKKGYYDELSRTHISQEAYDTSNKIWDFFKSQNPSFTFKDYHDFYLLLDSVLLACILQAYQSGFYEKFNINPLACLSSSNAAKNAFLFHSKIKIKLPSVEVQKDIRKSLAGGVTYSLNKRSKNIDIIDEKEGIHDNCIAYLDASSLYPTTYIYEKAPTDYIRTITDKQEIKAVMRTIYESKDPDAYYFVNLDVDPLTDPEKQKRVKLFPFLQTKIKLEKHMFSEFQQKAIESYYNSIGRKFDWGSENYKSAFTFEKRENLWLQSPMIHMMKKLGYTFSNIQKIHVFDADYIYKETGEEFYKYKQFATNSIERQSAKLVLNSFFGGHIINSLDFKDVKILDLTNTSRRVVGSNLNSPLVKKIKIVNEDTLILEKEQATRSLPYPLAIGSFILSSSKVFMMNNIQKIVDILIECFNVDFNDIYALYTDTDSWCFQLLGSYTKYGFKNAFHMMHSINQALLRKQEQIIFDASNFPTEYRDTSVKGAMKYFTYDFDDQVMIERVISLSPKVYTVKFTNGDVLTKSKGVSKRVADKILSFENYEEISTCMDYSNGSLSFENKATFMQIRSNDFVLRNKETNKVVLSNIDLKSYHDLDGEYKLFGETW